jgi:hypothetical protein
VSRTPPGALRVAYAAMAIAMLAGWPAHAKDCAARCSSSFSQCAQGCGSTASCAQQCSRREDLCRQDCQAQLSKKKPEPQLCADKAGRLRPCTAEQKQQQATALATAEAKGIVCRDKKGQIQACPKSEKEQQEIRRLVEKHKRR